MQHRLELGYLVVEVPDPTILTPVLADVVGLVAGEPTSAGALTWRNDGRAQRLVVEAGRAWFDDHGVSWALQRPDFHLFGAAGARSEAERLLAELRHRLETEIS